jgi:hypothetical protein
MLPTSGVRAYLAARGLFLIRLNESETRITVQAKSSGALLACEDIEKLASLCDCGGDVALQVEVYDPAGACIQMSRL